MDFAGLFDDFIALDGEGGDFEELQDSDVEEDDREWAENESSDDDEEMEDDARDIALANVEAMTLHILQNILNLIPSLCGDAEEKPKHKPKIEIKLVDRKKPYVDGEPVMRTLRFPRVMAGGSARGLAQLTVLLNRIHEALISGISTTKRDIYYKDVELWRTQKAVDTLVDDLAATWNLRRADLNIRASSKGLVSGSGLTIYLLSGEEIHGNDSEAIKIPLGEDTETFGVDEDIKWVLIVEKEAVFNTLCSLQITDGRLPAGRGILITGRGYPDIATRHLVKSLADALPTRIPIGVLVDCDPYGLDILSVYRYGSKGMQHENDRLAAKRVKWFGVRPSDLAEEGSNVDLDRLLPLTKADTKKAYAMLMRPNLPRQWKKELTKSLFLRRKAEIEIIETSGPARNGPPTRDANLLLQYVDRKLQEILARSAAAGSQAA
ncbi:Spo11/DNA topoisomerase VI subunit A [Coprinopsis sp. MPI-PUGE-AT-0042]|nr:Spo11/DNA topoisomerase VI subunit A [Coprinopsis sp. MPI-PUGE-AT-0042]